MADTSTSDRNCETDPASAAGKTMGTSCVRADADLLRAIAKSRLKILLTEDLQPVLKAEAGPYPHPVAICSIPKAGTYLLGRLLTLLGYVDPEVHAGAGFFSDYRWAPTELKRTDPERFLVHMPLEQQVTLIRPGQFLVGHLGCSDRVRAALGGFHKLFIKRELRATIVSFTRWNARTGRGGEETKNWQHLPDGPDKTLGWLHQSGQGHLQACRSLAGWMDVPDVHGVSFEELCGDAGQDRAIEAIQSVAAFVGVPQSVDGCHRLLSELLSRDTLTWSGQRSQVEPFWDDRVEACFTAMGGREINRLLGYEA